MEKRGGMVGGRDSWVDDSGGVWRTLGEVRFGIIPWIAGVGYILWSILLEREKNTHDVDVKQTFLRESSCSLAPTMVE